MSKFEKWIEADHTSKPDSEELDGEWKGCSGGGGGFVRGLKEIGEVNGFDTSV